MDQRSTVRVVFSANVAKHARVTGKVDRPSITENPCLEERIEPVASAPRSALPKGRRVAAFQQLMCCVSRDGMSMALSPSFGSEGTSTRNHVGPSTLAVETSSRLFRDRKSTRLNSSH